MIGVCFRSLQSEVEELEELDEKKDDFYETKGIEMKEFNENVEKFVGECQMQVENLRCTVNKVSEITMSWIILLHTITRGYRNSFSFCFLVVA